VGLWGSRDGAQTWTQIGSVGNGAVTRRRFRAVAWRPAVGAAVRLDRAGQRRGIVELDEVAQR
jgi:hypothetical protein